MHLKKAKLNYVILMQIGISDLHRYFSSRGPWHNMAIASLKESTRTWPVLWLKKEERVFFSFWESKREQKHRPTY